MTTTNRNVGAISLPEEMWLHIFGYLEEETLFGAVNRVRRDFCRYVEDYSTKLYDGKEPAGTFKYVRNVCSFPADIYDGSFYPNNEISKGSTSKLVLELGSLIVSPDGKSFAANR